jgi:hypothetical protein
VFRRLFKLIFFLAEVILSQFAMVAAFISVSWTGDIYMRVLGGLVSLYDTAYGFGYAFYKNEPFATTWETFAKAFADRLDVAKSNLTDKPEMALAAFILTLLCFKLAAMVFRVLRTGLLKKRPRAMKPAKKSKTGEAYNELYKQSKPGQQSKPSGISPSTQNYLERMKKGPGNDEPGSQF